MTMVARREKPSGGRQMRGLIFHIIHGSFVDGYGLRTTVFLKGCPLRCLWCCNVEGQLTEREIKVTSSLCDGCGRCIPTCSTNALALGPDGVVHVERSLCTNCGKCIDACFTGALDWFGWYLTVDELFDIVKRDEQYYRASGGGVTVGGGEPTFQPLFTYEFLKKCREHYIHSAVDTCGYTLTEAGLRVLEEADLLLFDLKGLDPVEHLKSTGVSNGPILANLKRLAAMGKPIIVRVPLIPGYTDSQQNVTATAELLSGLGSVERVDLIAYHAYGTVKYAQLGREYALRETQYLSNDRLLEIQNVFEGYGLMTNLGG